MVLHKYNFYFSSQIKRLHFILIIIIYGNLKKKKKIIHNKQQVPIDEADIQLNPCNCSKYVT